MKAGRTIQELAAEVQRQAQTKKDFVAPVGVLKMGPAQSGDPLSAVALYGLNGHPLALRSLAHEQLAANLNIPKAYYDRMSKEQPVLLAQNVNTWFQAKPTDKRLVRTLDGHVRGWLSNRYRPLDTIDLLPAVMPTLEKYGCQIVSTEITEKRFYLKAILPSLEARIQGVQFGEGHTFLSGIERGARVAAAIVISNSEVGCGALHIEPGVFEYACTNLAISTTHHMRKYHIGRAFGGDGDSVEEFLKDDTRKQRDQAFWMTVRDVVEGSFQKDGFDALVRVMEEAAGRKIEGDVPRVVELASDHFGIGDETRKVVLRHLIERGELTQFGLSAAITRAAADVSDYDFSTDMERVGMKVIELPQQEWLKLAGPSVN